jgi:signal transduction histidine kinase
MTDALLVLDREGVVRLANQAAYELFAPIGVPRSASGVPRSGFRVPGSDNAEPSSAFSPEGRGGSQGELIGKPIAATIGGALWEQLSTAMQRGTIENCEFKYRPPVGEERTLSVSASVMRGRGDEPVAIVCIARDISERKAHEQQLEEHAASQASLLRQLVNAQEAERRRLSMEIHDGPLQSLGVSLMAVDRASLRYRRGEYEAIERELSFLRNNLAATVAEVREVLADLSLDVLASYGLGAALGRHVEQFAEVTGISAEFHNHLDGRVPAEQELLMYRLAQEALANVRKHSGARRAAVTLEAKDGNLYLTVTDDGRGFNVDEALRQHKAGYKLGLRSMRERVRAAGGELQISSGPRKGTTLRFWCPIAEASNTSPLEATPA